MQFRNADPIDNAQAESELYNALALARRHVFSGESAIECGQCGADIPEARRLALPGVQTCVGCAAVAEASARNFAR